MKSTAELITELSKDMNQSFSNANQNIEFLKNLLAAYEGAVQDLIKVKQEYVTIVTKYSDSIVSRPSSQLLTGISTPLPRYPAQEMKADSIQLQKMGELVAELEDQKTLLNSQLRQLLSGVTQNISNAATTVEQINVFLDQNIRDSSNDGVYGSTSMLGALS